LYRFVEAGRLAKAGALDGHLRLCHGDYAPSIGDIIDKFTRKRRAGIEFTSPAASLAAVLVHDGKIARLVAARPADRHNG
jgi:hypothetical protein